MGAEEICLYANVDRRKLLFKLFKDEEVSRTEGVCTVLCPDQGSVISCACDLIFNKQPNSV